MITFYEHKYCINAYDINNSFNVNGNGLESLSSLTKPFSREDYTKILGNFSTTSLSKVMLNISPDDDVAKKIFELAYMFIGPHLLFNNSGVYEKYKLEYILGDYTTDNIYSNYYIGFNSEEDATKFIDEYFNQCSH